VAFQRKAGPFVTDGVGHIGRWIEGICTQNAQFKLLDPPYNAHGMSEVAFGFPCHREVK
jgi:hypothetical protein